MTRMRPAGGGSGGEVPAQPERPLRCHGISGGEGSNELPAEYQQPGAEHPGAIHNLTSFVLQKAVMGPLNALFNIGYKNPTGSVIGESTGFQDVPYRPPTES